MQQQLQPLSLDELGRLLPRVEDLPPFPERPRTRTERDRQLAHERMMWAYTRTILIDKKHSYHADKPEAEKALLRAERLANYQEVERLFAELDAKCSKSTERRERRRERMRVERRKLPPAQREQYIKLWPNSHQWVARKFSAKPYVSNNLDHGLKIRPLGLAGAYSYIEYSTKWHVFLLVVDYDCKNGIPLEETWRRAGLPEPTWVARTPGTERGHLVWALKVPVAVDGPEKDKYKRAKFWFDRIQAEYTRLLGGDASFVCKMTKNPASTAWEVRWGRAEPYDLKELDAPVTLPRYAKKTLGELTAEAENDEGDGRKRVAFHASRRWAYIAVRDYWGGSFEAWHEAVLRHVNEVNATFHSSLSRGHVRSIAKSIATYCWTVLSPAGLAAFKVSAGQPEAQARRGRKKGAAKRAELMEGALARLEAGESARSIAKDLDVDHKTISNWAKRARKDAEKSQRRLAETGVAEDVAVTDAEVSEAVATVEAQAEAAVVLVPLIVPIKSEHESLNELGLTQMARETLAQLAAVKASISDRRLDRPLS